MKQLQLCSKFFSLAHPTLLKLHSNKNPSHHSTAVWTWIFFHEIWQTISAAIQLKNSHARCTLPNVLTPFQSAGQCCASTHSLWVPEAKRLINIQLLFNMQRKMFWSCDAGVPSNVMYRGASVITLGSWWWMKHSLLGVTGQFIFWGLTYPPLLDESSFLFYPGGWHSHVQH